MELVKKLTKKQMKRLQEANGKRYPDINTHLLMAVNPPYGEYRIGDSAVIISNAKPGEVYRSEHAGRASYNLVVNVMSSEVAFCWILTDVSTKH